MVNENVNILLKLPWMEEREYMDMAEKITSELIERFDSSEKDKRFMTMNEFIQRVGGKLRYCEADTNAFIALVCRCAIERGYFVVLLPILGAKEPLSYDVPILDLVFRAAPIHAPELEWGSRGREFDSRHSDHKSNDFTLEIVGFFCLWADLIWF